MTQDQEQILKRIESGQISVEEALELLEALDEPERPDEVLTGKVSESPPATPPDMRSWWLLPTAIGAVVMSIGAPLVALGLMERAAIFWAICCGWMPLITGLTILTLGVWSRSALWFHLRIRNEHSGKRTFALSLPLPLSPAAWIVRLIQPFVPQLEDTGVDEAILALREGMSQGEQPLFIDVHDDDDGEHVMIFFG